jgi:hypothetical protein
LGVPAASAVIAARTYAIRVVPSRDMNIVSMACNVTTARDAADTVAFAIYDSTVQTRLASTPATAGKMNATGIQSVNLPSAYTIRAGVTYYAALVTDDAYAGTAPSLWCCLPPVGAPASGFGASIGIYEYFVHNGGGSAPASLTPASTVLAPFIWLRES